MRRWAALVLLVGAAACGIDRDGEPRALADADVPLELSPSTSEGPVPEGPSSTIYLVNAANRLQAVRRPVEGPATLEAVLTSLLEPPTPEESAQGLRSAIPDLVALRRVSRPVEGVATVDLTGLEDGTIATGEAQLLALAQIVYTATLPAEVDAVVFAIDGERVEVPDATGALTGAPRIRPDFGAVGPVA